MVTEYFNVSRSNHAARQYLYREFPEHFTWNKSKKFWKPRKVKRIQIGRLVYANPAKGERYYLRIMLNHVRGAISYENMRTWRGAMYAIFRQACEVMGLVESDKSLDDCLTESAQFRMPCSLRRHFVTIMVFCECTNIRRLWDNHLDTMSEDFRRTCDNSSRIEQMVLRDISYHLTSMGKDIRHYGLPELHLTGE